MTATVKPIKRAGGHEGLPGGSPSRAEQQRAGIIRRNLEGAFGRSVAGALLLWLALPPVGAWPLVFVAPLPWIFLVRGERLPGKRPYRAIWLAGLVFWLAELYWMTMPHPTTSLGWAALSAYLACLLPLFVGLSRVAVHRLGISVVVAAPVVWTGLELVRGYFLGGFTMASLGHVIYRWTAMIQTADLGGAYAVSFVVMFLAACLARLVRLRKDEPRRWWPAAAGLVALMAALGYGHFRIAQDGGKPAARIALIQGSTAITLDMGSDKKKEMFDEHVQLTLDTVAADRSLDLILWPESTFYYDILSCDKDAAVPEWWTGTADEFRSYLARCADETRQYVGKAAQSVGVPLLVGLTRRHFRPDGEAVYNTAILATRSSPASQAFDKVQMYDKIHLVMFGEYFPFADTLKFLYRFTPVNTLNIGLQAGTRPVAFELNGLCLAPNICFESVIPQVIRRQVNELAADGREPDILVNLTNDGWFFGSNELDLHMICGVFRAVECRKPFLIAANTGLSAWIDGNGRIRKQGPRLAKAVILADVARDGRRSLYLWWGDLPAAVCLLG
ncbi:MAG: apolipoprotein N-acyltransferase, partial [Thermoguttaceae bacterium]